MALLGIDFGTGETRALGVALDGVFADRVVSVPSSVFLAPGILEVGVAAFERSGDVPSLHGLKRLLGRDPADAFAQELARRQELTLRRTHPAERCMLATAAGAEAPIDEMVGELLGQAAEAARLFVAEPAEVGPLSGADHAAVIAVPGWYDAAQQAALVTAARHAGIEVARLIHDAAAVGLSVLLHQPDEDSDLCIVDAGAGGVSVSVVTVGPEVVRVQSCAHEGGRGGDDIDAALMAASHPGVRGRDRERVRRAYRKLKEGLDASDHAIARITLTTEDAHLAVNRWELMLVLGGVIQALQRSIDRALVEADVGVDELDGVLLCGGLSHLAAVHDIVRNAFERAPERPLGASRAICCGAALQAAILAGVREGPIVDDGHSTETVPPAASRPALSTGEPTDVMSDLSVQAPASSAPADRGEGPRAPKAVGQMALHRQSGPAGKPGAGRNRR